MLGHIPTELGDLDLILQLSLEASEQNLPLARLEAVHDRWNRPHVVRDREVNQLFVDKVFVSQPLDAMVNNRGRIEA